MTQLYKSRKVVIIGAGRVGSHVALCLMMAHLAHEIVFIDINEAAAQAQVLDLEDLASGLSSAFVIRTGTFEDCADARFVVMGAGRSRKPGETRLEMIEATITALKTITEPLAASHFAGNIISVSNPADVVTEYLYRSLKVDRRRIIGTGTALDSMRLRRDLSARLQVQNSQIQAFCMGEHGDSMFIAGSHITVEGMNLPEYLRARKLPEDHIVYDEVMEAVRSRGSSIVQGKGCTEFGIGQVVARIIRAVLHDEKRVLPLSVHLEGEYGQEGLSIGVPCMLGANGIEAVLEIDLNDREREQFAHSCSVIRGSLESIGL